MRKGSAAWQAPTREEVAWAAGLFEGEGSIGAYRRSLPRVGRSVQASLHMTDEKPVREFARIVGVGTVSGPIQRPGKPIYLWRVSNFEYVQHVAAVLWPRLAPRRRTQTHQTLEMGRVQPPRVQNGLAYGMFGKSERALDAQEHRAYNREKWRLWKERAA